MADLADTGQTTELDQVPGALTHKMRAALLEMRRGLLEQLRADEMEDEARALRRRGRIRQVRALEELTGVPPADVRRGG